jgi:predicted ATP-grasp superfamily ATP-dependent carboligase
MKVIVLDGLLNPAVACVRSLARAGHSVTVGSESAWCKAGLSRFCERQFTYPDPQHQAEDFIQCMVAKLKKEGRALLLPCSEPCALALSASRNAIFDAGGLLVMPEHEAMVFACNKSATTRRASELGIATPRTCILRNVDEAREMAPSATTPFALKPSKSEEVRGDRIAPTSRPAYSRNPQEFMDAYMRLNRLCSEILVQEFVPGDGVLYCLLLSGGELRAEFGYKRIRSVHPTGWGAALRTSISPDPVLHGATFRILRSIDPRWQGVGQVEFRIRRDGTPVFLEVNPRFWHSLPLAVFAGVDFPAMLAKMAENGDVPVCPGYTDHVCARWLLGDFRNLMYIWGKRPPGFPGEIPGRLKALLHFLLPVPGTYHDNFMPSDPLPELGDWIRAGTKAYSVFTSTVRAKFTAPSQPQAQDASDHESVPPQLQD